MSIAIHPPGTPANDPPIQQKPLSFDEFLIRYGGDNRYELISSMERYSTWRSADRFSHLPRVDVDG